MSNLILFYLEVEFVETLDIRMISQDSYDYNLKSNIYIF